MQLKYNTFISSLFALLVIWTVFAAIPYFRLRGLFPQVDSQIIFLHFLCGLMALFFFLRVLFMKYDIKKLNHPLIFIPFLLALVSLISSLFSNNFNISLSGSAQIGQGVFWYFDLTIMSIFFSQIFNLKKLRLFIFFNLILVTAVVSFFTFFPNWKGIPLSFYYFTDYLCFYGVLTFIILTTITQKIYIHILSFFILGFYFTLLDNRAASLFWATTALAAGVYYSFQLFKKNDVLDKIKAILFSDFIFIFMIFFISILILSSSIYFWSENYSLPLSIKGTLLDAPVVRGKIFETSLYSLDSIKNLLIGNGWGLVPDLLLENMNIWQYDELRLGYNLHFHTHNEIAEHLVSVGLIGCLLFVIYMYYIFKYAQQLSFSSKFGWLLFFKINCFWFMWVGTFAVFSLVISCFIFHGANSNNYIKLGFFSLIKKSKINRIIVAFSSICISLFLFYGTYLTYQSTKVHSLLNYTAIVQYLDNKKHYTDEECLSFYHDLNRGGYLLDKFLLEYSAHVLSLENSEINDLDLKVLNELKCKADNLIKTNNFTSSFLATAMRVDNDFFYKFSNSEIEENLSDIGYNNWFYKANIIAKIMPNRGDLLLPFISYAINNRKSKDALDICKKTVSGIEAFCYLIQAYEILEKKNLDKKSIKESIFLIKKSIDGGLFNQPVYGFWLKKDKKFGSYGLRGIPLSPNIIFLIDDIEMQELKGLIDSKT